MIEEEDGFLSFIADKKLGIDIGMPKLNDAILGLQQGTYYLVGGASGSGKTTFVDYSFLLAPLLSGRRVKIFYYSFEIGEYRKIAKMIAYSLYVKEGVEFSNMDIMNRTKVDVEPYRAKITESYYKFKAFVQDKVIFRFNPTNPTQVYKDLRRYAESAGEFVKQYVTNEEGEKVIIGEKYIPDDPNELVLCIVDHIGLSTKERGFNKKETIDKLDEYAILFRNICNYSFVYLQQFNRNISNIERQKLKGDDLLPSEADFSDSANTFQGCNTAITVFDASHYGIKKYGDVPITKKNRIISVLKNRDGEADLTFICDFKGKVNYIKEL